MLKTLTKLLSDKALVNFLMYVLELVVKRTPSQVDDKVLGAMKKLLQSNGFEVTLATPPATKAVKNAKTKKA